MMELELKKTCLDTWDVGAETVLTQEETAETIVPDYCPDIARIIDTEGKIFLHNRELADGKAQVSGSIRVTVLYIADGETGMRSLDFAMPFSVETDSRAMTDCLSFYAETEAEYLETRLVNPRKVFTHCKLVTRMEGCRKQSLSFCSDAEAEDALGIEKRLETQHTVLLTQIAEKEFTFSDTMELSAGREAAAEILCSRASETITEAKLVGSKLILKGIFFVSLLYRSASGACCSLSGELPFSQIMEVEGAAEDAAAEVRLQLTGMDVQISGAGEQEGRQFTVSLYVHATAFFRQGQSLTLLNDMYSTVYDLTYDAEPLTLTDYADCISRRQTVRETLETGVVADSILSLSAVCGSVSVGREGGMAVLRTSVQVRALYLDEGGAALMAERYIDVTCQIELPEDCRVSARACCPAEVQGSLNERGIEVRFDVDFRIQTSCRKKRVCIVSGKIASETPKDLTNAPSLVLRGLARDETLWLLAKRYNTTIPAILSANGLEAEEDVPQEKLLLIPRKRV
jgi:hypothetical protein